MRYTAGILLVSVLISRHLSLHGSSGVLFIKTTESTFGPKGYNLRNTTLQGGLSLLSCTIRCSLDDSCIGIGYRWFSWSECALFNKPAQSAGEGSTSSSGGLQYFLREDKGECVINHAGFTSV